jgi:hypothetical protein
MGRECGGSAALHTHTPPSKQEDGWEPTKKRPRTKRMTTLLQAAEWSTLSPCRQHARRHANTRHCQLWRNHSLGAPPASAAGFGSPERYTAPGNGSVTRHSPGAPPVSAAGFGSPKLLAKSCILPFMPVMSATVREWRYDDDDTSYNRQLCCSMCQVGSKQPAPVAAVVMQAATPHL